MLGLLLGVEVVEVAEKFVEAVVGGQELILVAEVILAELTRSVPNGFRSSAMVGSSPRKPRSAPGSPTLVSPVRNGLCPIIRAARPAVQLCSP